LGFETKAQEFLKIFVSTILKSNACELCWGLRCTPYCLAASLCYHKQNKIILWVII
jgi:hypothetical protein